MLHGVHRRDLERGALQPFRFVEVTASVFGV
jgi:hypothetical protein